MTYGQQAAIANLTAAVANFETEIMRSVVDQGARLAARKLVAEALRTGLAGTVVADKPAKRIMS